LSELQVNTRARVAIYDDLLSAPRVIDIEPAPVAEFIEVIATTTYEQAKGQGGRLPYTVIREIVENFIHAAFHECTVSLLDHGNTIRFSDQGPGILRKNLVLEPGISSATDEMKRFIRGVGSGFPIVREYLSFSGGQMTIGDNALEGTVVTLQAAPAPPVAAALVNSPMPYQSIAEPGPSPERSQSVLLDERERTILVLMHQGGAPIQQELASQLGVSVATINRSLQHLEQLGMIEPVANRKRILSNAGLAYLQAGGLT